MKPKIQTLILIFILNFIGCDKPSKNDNKSNNLKEDKTILEKGFSKLDTIDFMSDRLLISKKNNLKGFKSLNIKGHRFYELDKKGNIILTSDISNNYSVYTYDKDNRLIKSENKQHHPPRIYNEIEYKYSNEDLVIEIIKTSYENNKPLNTEVIKDNILLNHKSFFVNKKQVDFYINSNKDKIIAYDSDMVFCCGNILKGKNKLTYYINKNELIDSLVIENINNSKKMNFKYQYE
jgi:hypothetical protein